MLHRETLSQTKKQTNNKSKNSVLNGTSISTCLQSFKNTEAKGQKDCKIQSLGRSAGILAGFRHTHTSCDMADTLMNS